jgi:hypothetical protein
VDVADAAGERGREFLEHSEAEILEHGHRLRQRDEAALAVGLEPKLPNGIGVDPRDAHVAIGITE